MEGSFDLALALDSRNIDLPPGYGEGDSDSDKEKLTSDKEFQRLFLEKVQVSSTVSNECSAGC